VGSTLFTNLTGQVVQHYSYTAIFVIMGFLHPLSYLIVRYFIKNDSFIGEPIPNRPQVARLHDTG
jgi:hypothetical protein